eukprot:scaffold512_cov86-Skeletonema_dohrnii-CCMP3373.AAC.2
MFPPPEYHRPFYCLVVDCGGSRVLGLREKTSGVAVCHVLERPCVGGIWPALGSSAARKCRNSTSY